MQDLPVSLEDLPRWLSLARLLTRPISDQDYAGLSQNLYKISEKASGMKKADIWKDLANIDEKEQVSQF
jgi:hypothetical protein